MKKLFSIFAVAALVLLSSCTTTDSGNRTVRVSWGGETDMTQVYDEGVHYGFGWLFDKNVEYNAKEQTMTIKKVYNDAKDMEVPVEVTLYFKPIGSSLNKLHKFTGEDYKTVKLTPLFLGAVKEVVPQYTAQELNKTDRAAAESKIKAILDKDLLSIYTECVRVAITDVDIPIGISHASEATAVQEANNILASKKEAEKVALAAAKIAEAKGNFEAAQYDAKTKDVMSQPKMLELYRAETARIWAEKGVSPYGEHNVFGASPNLIKSL